MLELLSRIPPEISFNSLNFEGVEKRTSLSGTSKDVISVSVFVSRLAKEGNASTESSVNLGGKNAFTNVRLDSLSVSKGNGVNYSISFNINKEAFLK